MKSAQARPGSPAWLLLLGALLVGVGGVLGVAHSFDHSPLGVASGAVWVALVPAVVAIAIWFVRPTVGIAVSAGAGVVASARLLADMTLLTGPNTAVRPELFYEVSGGAQPFTMAAGGWIVILGDLVMVVAGVLAARRLASGPLSRSDLMFDAAPLGPLGPTAADSGPRLLAEALESAELPDAVRPDRNNWIIAAGFVGVVGLLTAYLGLPYRGGYLAGRYLPAELDLWGIGAALAVAAVATGAVLAAAVLPRPVSFALLGGVATGAAVPFLTAIAVRAVGAPVLLNPGVALGLAAAVVLAGAGLLARGRLAPIDDAEPPGPTSARADVAGAVSSLLVAGCAAAAWRLPQLHYNGHQDPVLANGFAISSPLALPFLLAAVPPLVGGLLWLVPITSRAGRAVCALGWIGLVYAVAHSLNLLGQVVASASVPAGFAPPTWSAGPGLWWGIVGIVLGLAALGMSIRTGSAATDESPLVARDDTLTRSRSAGTFVASGLTVVVILALVLPVYRTATGTSATLLVGFQLESWGVAALGVGAVAAAWAAGRTHWASQAAASALTGAALLAIRLVIPPSVRAQDGFRTQPGLYAGYAAVVLFIGGALVLTLLARRIRMTTDYAEMTT